MKTTKDYTEPQQQCKVTADHVAHQLLQNSKGNKLHVPRREKMPRQTVTESKLTSPFLMEDLLHGIKALTLIACFWRSDGGQLVAAPADH